ncbi:MAG: hypothetical protein FJ044_05130, partial [Candidatus Cloacimonetes bacterium]|nr:hypothetical protein [Candidatus Cloacimonadota bacterium]
CLLISIPAATLGGLVFGHPEAGLAGPILVILYLAYTWPEEKSGNEKRPKGKGVFLCKLFGRKPKSEVAVVGGYREDDLRGERCLAELIPAIPNGCGKIKTDMGIYLLYGAQGHSEVKLKVFGVYHEALQVRAIFLRDGRIFIRDDMEDEEYLKVIPALAKQAKEYFATH